MKGISTKKLSNLIKSAQNKGSLSATVGKYNKLYQPAIYIADFDSLLYNAQRINVLQSTSSIADKQLNTSRKE
jgi:hypothetical protein